MRRDVKALIIIFSIIFAFVVIIKSCGRDKKKINETVKEDIFSETLDEIEDIIAESPKTQPKRPPRPTNPYVSRTDERDDFNLQQTSNPSIDTRPDPILLNIDPSDTISNNIAQVQKTDLEVEMENRGKDSFITENIQAVANEAKKTDEFYASLAATLNPNLNATQARARAKLIMDEAASVRKDAESQPSEVKSAMLQRASIMEDYSRRISANGGNSRKMRILIQELKQKTE